MRPKLTGKIGKKVISMPEDYAYIEEDVFTDEDWEDMLLKAEISMRHPPGGGKEAGDGETAE